MNEKHFNFDHTFQQMMQSNKLNTVVILAHMNPDGDAAGSVMSLAHYIKANYPEYNVYPYLASTLDKGAKKMVQTDTCFQPFDKPELSGTDYAVIVCDTATKARMIGLELYEQAKASIVIDHHASNQGYGDVNYTKISEACAENVYYTLDYKKLLFASKEPHPNAADYIYLGILHDTGGFTRANATIMGAASSLIALGVDHHELMKTLQTDTYEDLLKRAEIIKSAVRVLDGKVAYICIDRETSLAKGIGYEDIHPVSGILRDCDDIELAFSMYEEEPNIWRCSFRSDGIWINVNELLTPFGGGGHAGAAGLRKETSCLEQLKNDLLGRILKMREGK